MKKVHISAKDELYKLITLEQRKSCEETLSLVINPVCEKVCFALLVYAKHGYMVDFGGPNYAVFMSLYKTCMSHIYPELDIDQNFGEFISMSTLNTII